MQNSDKYDNWACFTGPPDTIDHISKWYFSSEIAGSYDHCQQKWHTNWSRRPTPNTLIVRFETTLNIPYGLYNSLVIKNEGLCIDYEFHYATCRFIGYGQLEFTNRGPPTYCYYDSAEELALFVEGKGGAWHVGTSSQLEYADERFGDKN